MRPLVTAIVFWLLLAMPRALPAQTAPPDGVLDEPRLLSEAMSLIENFGSDETGQPLDGLYPEFGHMITGAGWISVGPGYRRHLFGRHAVIDASAAISWRAYKIAQAQLEFPHVAADRLAVGTKVLWQDLTQVRYFGSGADSLESAVSDYRVQAANLVGFATWRPRSALTVTGVIGWLSRPGLSSSTGTFDRDEPDTLAVHRDEPAAGLTRQPRFAHGELSIAADTRDHPSYPTSGGLVRIAWATYRDRPSGRWTFDRYESEAAYVLPLTRHGVVAGHVWGVFSDTLDGRAVPFYLLPSLGGHNTLRGYADYRFHDRHLLAGTVESRWALFDHLDTALFFDAGNVAARPQDLDFARTSYGIGLRLHTDTTTVARLDIARSPEGWRVMLKLSDLLRLRRLNRRTAAIPFVP